jgi:hypothetical protein
VLRSQGYEEIAMPMIERPRGVRIDLPEEFQIADRPQSRARRGAPRRGQFTGTPSAAEHEALLSALADQHLELVDTLPIEQRTPQIGANRRGRPSGSNRRSVGVSVRIAPGENAAILVQQDGVFSWKVPDNVKRSSPGAVGTRRRGAAAGPITEPVREGVAHFTIAVRPDSPSTKASRQRGLISDVVVRGITVFVLKFVAHAVVGNVMSLLERHVDTGLVLISKPDPSTWRRVDDVAAGKLTRKTSAHVLLLVHGTFSSTIGGFAALGVHPWGKALLQSAIKKYDLVLGYDHRTLAVDPLENAGDLMARLRSVFGKNPPILDIVCHSRGGLVTRSLIELIAPYEDWRPVIEHAVFVASTNRGTLLAEPRNWNSLLDLYTNVAMAATRALGLLPQTALFGAILGGAIQGVGALVKALVTAGITDRAAPGLAAMEPDGPFITKINQVQPGQPDPAHSNYYAVSSDFAATAPGDEPLEMPPRLLSLLADKVMDSLMKESNDIIVNVSSMTAIDPTPGGFIDDELAFGRNRSVYHSNYFGRPEVAAALARWLELPPPTFEAPNRRRGGRPVSATPPYVVSGGSLVGATIPLQAETNVLVASSSSLVDYATGAIADKDPAYVVVRRPTSEGGKVYAFAPDELVHVLEDSAGSASLGVALGLRARTASAVESISTSFAPSEASGRTAPAPRSVLMDGDLVVGVLPEAGSLPTTSDLLARAVPKPARLTKTPRQKPRGGMTKGSSRGGRRARGHRMAKANGNARPAPRTRLRAAPPPRSSRTTVSSRHAATGAAASPQVVTHVFAEMPAEIAIGAVETIQVDISREQLRRRTAHTAQTGKIEVAEERPLIVQAIPRANVAIVGTSEVRIPVPRPGEPAHCSFTIKATHASEGRVWVVVRQDQLPLLTLVLKPTIVKRAAKRSVAKPLRADAAASDPTPMPSIPTLRILEETQGTSTFYRYDLDVPDLGILQEYRSTAIKGDRDAYVQRLYARIEADWGASNDDIEAFQASLRAFGGELLDELVPSELQAVLWEHRTTIETIMVLSDEPFIPWELVHLKAPGSKTLPDEDFFLGQMGLVRWLYGTRPPFELAVRERRARYVIPDYPDPDWALPETINERQYLETTFGARAIEPHLNPVRRALSAPGTFDLLHFAGHGSARGGSSSDAAILLEGRMEPDAEGIPTYREEPMDSTVVAQFADLMTTKGTRPIVVLNACQAGRMGRQLTSTGGFARSFLGAGVGAFISSLWSVGDQPAREFTETFYDTLRTGEPVSQAVIAARHAARAAGDATWLAYVVYANPAARLQHV